MSNFDMASLRAEEDKDKAKTPPHLIMALTDGETYSELAGCAIYEVPNGMSADDIEQALKEGTLKVVHRH